MKVMAQMAMVMNLDKCIGCHTCSVTCKQAWTNRAGTEYVWFNNVETRPGQGYPRRYEDQDEWKGGWSLNKRGRLQLRAGGRLKKLATIFSNPKMPSIDDYYEPWTYDYATLTNAPAQEHIPVARPRSLISGKTMKVNWSANWDDNLGGSKAVWENDPVLAKASVDVKRSLEETFMFYLPRICEHCLNPSCAASCPSGAIYKRSEDGIVLVDQDRCRGWRMCVSGCPYKKVYFNHRTGKAEKCTFCFPRIEVGLPTVCSETCVGRLRYLGLVLYDADRVLEAASTPDDQDLYEAQRSVLLDPHDPDVVRAAERDGIPHDWIEAAQRSPIHALINVFKVALPLHPEYRTMPMVWYVPPLSPVVDVVRDTGNDAEDPDNLFAAIDKLRIPIEYLAELFTAGDVAPVEGCCASWLRCAPTCVTSTWVASRTPRSPRRSAWGRRRCMTCTASSPWPSTTSATSSRVPMWSRRILSRSSPPSARSTTREAPGWAARDPSARGRERSRCRSRWRTSQCSATGRPRTT